MAGVGEASAVCAAGGVERLTVSMNVRTTKREAVAETATLTTRKISQ
jgi:hypothetical protein